MDSRQRRGRLHSFEIAHQILNKFAPLGEDVAFRDVLDFALALPNVNAVQVVEDDALIRFGAVVYTVPFDHPKNGDQLICDTT